MNIAVLCPGQKCSVDELEEDILVEKEMNESKKLIGNARAEAKVDDGSAAIREAVEAKARADYAVTSVEARIVQLERAIAKQGNTNGTLDSNASNSSSGKDMEMELGELEDQL